MIAILGAGVTGLSVAYHLKSRSYRIFEQAETPGGLCRSTKVDGFTFDYTGHLLHINDPQLKQLLINILPCQLLRINRNAAIYYKRRYLPYPFQANTFGLPKQIVFDCVMGFIKTHMNRKAPQHRTSFKDWVLQTFGDGFAKHFFIPYNQKLWQMDLKKLTSDWVSWSIPRPTIQEVVQGALGIQNTGMGYNASFLFPQKGGIGILPDAMSKHVRNMNLKKKLISVNLTKKRLNFDDGEVVSYDTLISTIPLPQLLRKIEDLADLWTGMDTKLRFVSVQNLNIGINRKRTSDFHWIYFPEPEFPFYRVGFYSNFSPSMAPKKASSMYIEISSTPQNKKNQDTLMEESIDALQGCGILNKGDRIVATNYANIEYAYVVYDIFRQKKLSDILHYLKKHQVLSIGRFGAWTYSSMEDALKQGRETARFMK
jgi:protoporphyrinogen oxidase